jgi:flagellin-like hook-associated protein FlgL
LDALKKWLPRQAAKKNPAGGRKTKTPRKGKSTMALSTINLTSGMRANLFSLQKTAKEMEVTQNRLSTGLKVNTALDDPLNFFAAQGHRTRAGDLASRKDGMSEAIQTIKAANNGIGGITNLIAQAKSLAQSALSATSADADILMGQFNEVLSQIDTVAADSGYKGVNLLQSGELTVQFAPSSDASTLNVSGFGDTSANFSVTSGLTASDWSSAANIETAITGLETATDTLRVRAKTLSSDLSIITAREDFTSKMINTLEDGAAKLTEADMNEEGANMLMLQTRQALGTTSLSLASQAAQSVLRLF